MTTATTPTIGRSHTVSRVFDAPRDLVWKANTEPERLAQWMGPAGTTCTTRKMEFRPGGVCHYCMHLPDGTEMWGKAVYKKIEPQDRIEHVQSFSDKNEGITVHPMSPTWPRQMYSISTFEDLGDGRTRLTIEWAPYDASAEEQATFDAGREGVTGGWKGSFDKLATYLQEQQH